MLPFGIEFDWTVDPLPPRFKSMAEPIHLTLEQMEAGLESIRQSPKDTGTLKLIVRRPQTETREVLEEAQLDPGNGLVGDNWKARGSRSTPDGSANPEMQLNLMNARVIELLAPEQDRWALAGDQLFVDFDLSESNVPPGTRLAIGSAVIEVTAPPHLGCKKFSARYGPDAVKFVNSPEGKQLHLRGINAKVVQVGTIHPGDFVKKV
jgi:MOSC domain